MTWRSHLTDDEIRRLEQIASQRKLLTEEYRRIYERCRLRGKVGGGVPIETKRGDIFYVDRADLDLISPYRWFSAANKDPAGKERTPYIQGKVEGRRVYLHRFLTQAPKGSHVDHIDGDPLNNCRSNLRIVNASQNLTSAALRKDDSEGVV